MILNYYKNFKIKAIAIAETKEEIQADWDWIEKNLMPVLGISSRISENFSFCIYFYDFPYRILRRQRRCERFCVLQDSKSCR